MTEYVIAEEGDINNGERRIVQLEGREIAVFNVDGEYYAYTNWCAHQSGPCCEGSITGTMNASFDEETLTTKLDWSDENKILNCPWHGWEYDVTNGKCLSRNKVRLPSHDVEISDGNVIVTI